MDDLNNINTQLLHGQKEISKELKYQNEEVLPEVNQQMDRNITKIKKVNSKLDAFMARSSNLCLMITLVLEIVALVLIIIYFP